MSVISAIAQYPATWIALTGVTYLLADTLYHRARCFPLLNPVLVSVLLLIAVLKISGVSYATYFAGAKPIHLLLGPATVALAIPLYLNLAKMKQYFIPLSIALLVGSTVGIVSVLILGQWMGLSWTTILSFAPKSCTTPIAMALSQEHGGLPSLTANAVIVAGIAGAAMALPLFRWLKIEHEVAQGFALGLASHGVGTARAFQISDTAGAFAGLAMGFNGVVTALILPILLTAWYW
ncbi:LrgB family protein [Deefgea sp. CFH1-16]|uniref:LrgB family protein n=1 Tax=Deefgea sp. CFH1-16 TaxID=2675457 RepID=UPI0015F40321|nr:LrgB family protein [Deefgea sp. CFH1-16]MBM5575746.1 LrgB family protein [Deefgea sp. CFH1-16]